MKATPEAVDRLLKESWDRWMKDSDNAEASEMSLKRYTHREWLKHYSQNMRSISSVEVRKLERDPFLRLKNRLFEEITDDITAILVNL